MKPHYRIVSDNFNGYEVQFWRWWWPFWEMPVCNTHTSIENAEKWAKAHSEDNVVKYLGKMNNN